MDRRAVTWKPQLRRWTAHAGKWIAGITAVLTLLLGVQQLGSWIITRTERSREADALLAVARQQASRQEFAGAWQSLDAAAGLRDDDALLDARIEVAFAWLQEGRPGPGNPFSVITDPVIPALDRALLTAQGSRRADILAHLGWATFLRWRETQAGDPAARYREALAIDPGNVFANAMSGHWMLWQHEPVAEALSRFQMALASGRERPFVRRLMIAALVNQKNDAADLELLRVVNDMRRGNEPLDADMADRFFTVFALTYGRRSPAPGTDLPAPELAATYEYVVNASPRARQSGQLETIRGALRGGGGARR